MKILLDSCISSKILKAVQEAGQDVEWVGNWPEDPGDDEILNHAHRQGSILVTLDKDFGELAIVHDLPHGGILRLVDLTIQQQIQVCLDAIKKHADILRKGAIVTAGAGRIRIRPKEE